MELRLFSIGEVAKMFHLSVSSLRHYEDVGLLKPERIDPDSGYRYYSTRQFEVLNTIRYLRVLDMPLGEIADFLGNRDVERIKAKLRAQKEAVMEREAELKRIERKIDNRLRMIEDAEGSKINMIRLVQKPPCRLVWVGDSLKIRGFLDMEAPIRKLEQTGTEAVVFLGKVGVGISEDHLRACQFDSYDGIFLVLDDEDRFDGRTEAVPGALCVSGRFHGSHTESGEQYRRLADYIAEHKLEICGFSREITMIDYGITNDTEKFVTEISIPVACR